jgi:hypothetical protein
VIEGLKRSWRSRSSVALLIVAPPFIALSVGIAGDLLFLFKSKSSLAEVVDTQATKIYVSRMTSLQAPDISTYAWMPSVSLALLNNDVGHATRCEAIGALSVFGDENVENEFVVRRKLQELKERRNVYVKYALEGGKIECRLPVAQGTRWIPFAIFLVLFFAFLVAFIEDMVAKTSTGKT